ncbi:MAG TPA: hypothetical protein ENK43_06775 [Planctomycetes bacterium]|nr:hypothetical protein [Planctomycetota bacterium]
MARHPRLGDSRVFVQIPRPQPLRVVLRLGRRLPGRVIDRATDAGIPGATISALVGVQDGKGGFDMVGVLKAVSGEDGSFAFPLPDIGRNHSLTFRVRATGYATPFPRGVGIYDGKPDEDRLIFKLNRGRELRIQLVSAEDGVPVPNVKVLLDGRRSIQFTHQVITDADGMAVVKDFPPSSEVAILVMDKTWALDTTAHATIDNNTALGGKVFPIEAKGNTSLTIPVVPSATLSGQVRDAETQAPLAGIWVEVGRFADFVNPASIFTRRVITDDDGRFRVGGLWRTRTYAYVLPGAWCNWPDGWNGEEVGKDGFSRERFVNSVELAKEASADIVIHAKKTAVLEGRVVDENGKPVAGARLQEEASFVDWRRFTDRQRRQVSVAISGRDGRFRLEKLTALSDFRLQCAHPDFPRSVFGPFPLRPGETMNAGDMVLRRSAVITVEVQGPSGPVPGVQVLLTPRGRKRLLDSRVTVTTDESGVATTTAVTAKRVNWRILNLPPGLVTRGLANEAPVDLALDGSDRILITLERRHFLVGVMQTADGKPFTGGTLLLRRVIDERTGVLSEPIVRFSSDSEGRFHFPVPPGTYVIEWMDHYESMKGHTKEVNVRYSVKSGSPITADQPTTVVAGDRIPIEKPKEND